MLPICQAVLKHHTLPLLLSHQFPDYLIIMYCPNIVIVMFSLDGSGTGESETTTWTGWGQQRVPCSTGLFMSVWTVPDCICRSTVNLWRQNKQCSVSRENYSVFFPPTVTVWCRFLCLCFTCFTICQVEGLRGELLRTRKEMTELQRARLDTFQPIDQLHGSHADREVGRGGQRGPGTEYSWINWKEYRCLVIFMYQLHLEENPLSSLHMNCQFLDQNKSNSSRMRALEKEMDRSWSDHNTEREKWCQI